MKLNDLGRQKVKMQNFFVQNNVKLVFFNFIFNLKHTSGLKFS